MRNSRCSDIPRYLRTLLKTGTASGLTDGELLDRFRCGRGESAEFAFAAILARHGPMVLRVCRSALRDLQDAEDAFQATFLILARKAGTVRRRDAVGPYLNAVAFRVAANLRTRQARRRRREARVPGQERGPRTDRAGESCELGQILQEEIARLPQRFQSVSVLCDLEGKTYAAAADVLQCPIGTVMSRLAEARRRLRLRLTRRGLAPGAALPGALFSRDVATAAVPGFLSDSTVRAAIGLTGKGALAPGVVSSSVLALGEDVLKAMLFTKFKVAAASLLIAGVVAAGSSVLAIGPPEITPNDAPPALSQAAQEDVKLPPAAQVKNSAEPPRDLSDQLRDELDLLSVRLDTKRAELERAQAQRELALAVVATHQRLNQRRPGMVSAEEITKAESEVRIAAAEIDIVQSQIQELELLLAQAKRLPDHPDRIQDYLDRARSAGTVGLASATEQRRLKEVSAALERRLTDLERKLDRVLRALEGLKPEKSP